VRAVVVSVLAWTAASVAFTAALGFWVTMRRRRERPGQMPGMRMPAGRPWPGLDVADEHVHDGPEPPRRIHAVWPLPGGDGVGVCCECRTLTELIIDVSGVPDGGRIDLPEQSFTCDGCGTTHWFTITPPGAAP
jgi:hypothetical protein